MRNRKRRYINPALLLIIALAVCAFAARRTDRDEPPLAHIDPKRLSVDGVTLGMTGDQVMSVLGKPLEDEYDGDTVCWTYGRSTTTVTMLLDARDNPSVISVEGRQLAVGEHRLVPRGTNHELAMQRLAALGKPEIEKADEECAFALPAFHLFTLGVFLGFEGTLRLSMWSHPLRRR